MDAEPDSEVLNEYVKKCMNTIFQKLKAQISLKNNYSGEGVLHAMLKLIKFVTIKIMKPKSDDDEEEEDDNEENYFSEHVVDFDEKLEDQGVGYEDEISKLKEEFSTRQQLASLQHESQIKSMEVKIEGLNREIEKQKEIVIKNEEIQFKSQSIVQTIRPETPPPQPLPQIERRSSSPIILEKEVIIENKQEVEPIAVQETADEIEQENHEENKIEVFVTEERPKTLEPEEKQVLLN
jgi:TolA-binding protein